MFIVKRLLRLVSKILPLVPFDTILKHSPTAMAFGSQMVNLLSRSVTLSYQRTTGMDALYNAYQLKTIPIVDGGFVKFTIHIVS